MALLCDNRTSHSLPCFKENAMSQKAICPRGHIWDPSTLSGLPPTEKPRCPICGEEEPLRASNALTRLKRWCQNNPVLAGVSVLSLLLVIALVRANLHELRQRQAANAAVEQALFEGEQVAAKLRTSLRAVDADDREQQQKRQAEMETARWQKREKEYRAQLRDAEKAAIAARKQRDEQIQQRKLAEELAQTADQVRQEALSRRAEASRKLVKMYVADGTRRMENGDLSSSLLWFAEALRLAESEKLPTATHRLRLAAVLAQCPRPLQMWLSDKKINAVQLSSDGKRVLIATANAVEVRDVATGKRNGEPLAHTEAVTHAVFSPDGKRVLTAAADMTLHLWELEKGEELFSAQQLQGPVVGLAFSGDGRRFLTVTDKAPMGATEVELHVRDAASGEATRDAALGSEISPRPAQFSPDGKWILTVCRDNCARIWDIATGKQIGSAFYHPTAVIHASFSADGERVLTASVDGTARVWKAKSGEPVTPILKHGAALNGAGFSPAGSHVLTFGEDRGVRVWDASKGEAVGPGLRHAEAVSDAVFSPDGRYVLTTSADGAARLWDYRTGQEVLPPLWHHQPIRYAAFTPAGNSVSTLAGQVMRVWDLTAGEFALPPDAPGAAGLVVFSPDGKHVLRATETAVRVYDTTKNEPVGGTLPHPNKVSTAAFSSDGKRVLTVSHQRNGDELEGHFRVWETATGQLLGQPMEHPRSVLEASFSRDGRQVLTACQDGRARLWDVDKNALVGEPMEHKEDLRRALFAPDGKRLLTLDAEGGLRLWDADTAEAVGPTWGHRKPIHHLVFSPDGQHLATACEDGTATVWQASTGHEIASTPVQTAPILRASFSSDGKRLVTVSDDHRVRVWDAATGKPISPSLRHRAAVALAAFSDDGKRLVTVATDGLRVWDAASGEPLAPLVRSGRGQPVIHAVALNRDGRLVVATGAAGDPSSRWSLDFRPEERPAADLLRVAEVLSAQRLVDPGKTAPLDPTALSKVWRDVQTKYGSAASSRPTRWRRQQSAGGNR
jgi:WD40 repeat protein